MAQEWSFHFSGKASEVGKALAKAKGGPQYSKALVLARAFHGACDPNSHISIAAADSDVKGQGFNIKFSASDVKDEPKKK